MNERDLAWLYDMRTEAQRIAGLLEEIDRDRFDHDVMAQYAVIHALTIFGEAARRVSEDGRAQTPELPWSAIIGMRNYLVHSYDRIDLDEVWSAASKEVPGLLPRLDDIVPDPDTDTEPEDDA